MPKTKPKKSTSIKQKAPFQLYQIVAVLVLTIAVGGYIVSRIFAASGTLTLSPASSSLGIGTTFTVTVNESSGTDAVNAVEADLTYPANMLQFVSSDATTSAFPVEAANTGGNGTVTLSRGGQTAVTGSQVVAVLTFKTLAVGAANIAFAGSSALVRASDQTNVLVGTTGGTYTVSDKEPPTVPAGLTMSGHALTTIDLAWTASTDDVGVTGYKIFRNGAQVGTSATTTFHDTGLVPGTTYTYTVEANDAAGNTSAQSAASMFATLPDTTAPSVPGTPTQTAHTMSGITIGWTASTDNVAVTSYKVFRNNVQVATPTTTSFADSGLVPGTSYSYTVAATDAAGNTSAKSAAAAFSTLPDTQAPTAPTGVVTTLIGQNVQIAWTASTDNVGVTGYKIFRSALAGSSAQVGTSSGPTFTDLKVPPGTYSYLVTAVDAAGNTSANSASTSVTVYTAGDINHDGKVNVFDLSVLLSNWNKTGVNTSDLNGDNVVNIFDLSILLTAWTG